ncbi:TonB-dependent siderophore receptor [Flavobacterium sp. MK4S-17]|uniref:TonB-dependent receptor plug domain-containing protein n=1 Tax=Flavobacterium sp. MK4S-17 TaxID=2543737 RepID=UPI001357DD7F|nr:TonB-dependent receptor [Flavobacterium sp. MK4S-17]
MRVITKSLLYTFLFTTVALSAQDTENDTIKTNLEEVVITGQFEPQSIKKSVFNVRVITSEDIQRRAANNLADVLNQYLNITVRPNGSDGRSTVSMFGLDAQYFKILLDNIPLVSDTGLGNNIDLTQINLDDVERIEIIEGSMGVTHGANAVTGILNIITKKTTKNKWEISATAQEETVGKEFAFFDKGRHIQSFKVSHGTDNWYASVGANRNDFAGFYDNMKGKEYKENDGLRGFSWLPKQQFATNAIIGYNKGIFRLFYKFDYYNENIDFYNPIVTPVDNYPFPDTYKSEDKRIITDRYYHHLNSYGHLFSKLVYNVSASYQKQRRDEEKYTYQILSDTETNNDRQTYQSKEIIYSTGNVTNFFNTQRFDLQVGYEAVHEKGFASANSGTFRNEDANAQDVNQTLENYDVYASAEIKCTERFSIRPGFRYSFQSKFSDQNAISAGFRYLFNYGLEARASVGKSYRTPNFDELYTYFVDSNHDLRGNASLVPETSLSYEASIKKSTFFDSGLNLSNNLIISYMDVDDRISQVLAATEPNLQYRYQNIDKYKMWNISTSHQLAYKNIEAKVGAALVGISQKIDLAASNVVSDDRFLYSFQLNSNISYNVPSWNTVFSLYYKYNGRFQQFREEPLDSGDVGFFLTEIEAYSMMDASVRKSFFKNRFDVTLGSRNLFNVKNLQTSGAGASGVHSAGTSALLLAYGRSYFLKLTYNLNI